jgi:hypothetical protein
MFAFYFYFLFLLFIKQLYYLTRTGSALEARGVLTAVGGPAAVSLRRKRLMFHGMMIPRWAAGL